MAENRDNAKSCQASVSPAGATCSYPGCGTVATVRLTTSHGADDLCELCWPRLKYAVRVAGFTVTDTTGDLDTVRAELPSWNIWTSTSGRHYGTRVLDGGQGVTVSAFLVGSLRTAMLAVDAQKTPVPSGAWT